MNAKLIVAIHHMHTYAQAGIEAGAVILPFLPYLWSAITRNNSTLHRLDSPVGHAALRLIVDVGMAGLEPLKPVGEEEGGEAGQPALVPPFYRDPSTVLMPLLAATTAVRSGHELCVPPPFPLKLISPFIYLCTTRGPSQRSPSHWSSGMRSGTPDQRITTPHVQQPSAPSPSNS